jgi:hypothetical protein
MELEQNRIQNANTHSQPRSAANFSENSHSKILCIWYQSTNKSNNCYVRIYFLDESKDPCLKESNAIEHQELKANMERFLQIKEKQVTV